MWGDAGVSLKRDLSNGKSNWGPGGSPTTIDIQRIGIMRRLTMLTDATATFTAGVALALDTIGPHNVYKLITLTPNQQSPIIRLSGYSARLADIMCRAGDDSFSDDTGAVSMLHADPNTDFFNASRTITNGDWFLYHVLHTSQYIKSLGCEIGLWPLENPAVQLQLEYTPASVSSVSPFSVDSKNNTTAPAGGTCYYGDPTSDVVLATPTVDVRRGLWEVPESANDDPPYVYVTTWLEEAPQGGNINGATDFTWKAVPLSGVIMRLGVFIYDGGATAPVGAGVAESSLGNSNSLGLLFGADTQKFAETGRAAHVRMQEYYGAAMPQGAFFYDFLGKDLTLTDVIDTYTTPEVRFEVHQSVALGAQNSFARFIRQTLVPIELSGRG